VTERLFVLSLAFTKAIFPMDRTYWIARMRAAMRMARQAATAESRLIHFDMAGRYSIKAANVPPFMLPRKGPATTGERTALRLPNPNDRSQGSSFGGKLDPPGGPDGDGPGTRT
jgi:hypothetical protein